jgi:DNA-binding NtrC family response regulator
MSDETLEPEQPETLDAIERKHIARVLIQTDCNLRQASSVLGIDRRTLYRKLDSYGWMRNGNRVSLYKHLATLDQAEAR